MTNAIAVLDPTGHLSLAWDPDNPQDVADAERAVLALQKDGFTFWRTEGQGASLGARHVDAAELVRSTSHVAPAEEEPVEAPPPIRPAIGPGDVDFWVEPAEGEAPRPDAEHAQPPTSRPLAPRQQQLLDALKARGRDPLETIPIAVQREIAGEWGTSTGAVAGTHNNLKSRLRRAQPEPAAAAQEEPRQVGVGTRAVRGG